jgi:origin recognition complex subunit 5
VCQPDLSLPLYVYGPSGGGKSGVVRGVLDALGTRHAVLDCVTCCTARSLFEAALSQFHRHVPRAANSYVSWSACDSPAAFVAGLQEVVGEYGRAVLVLENALELEKRRDVRTLLLSLQTLCHSAAVTTVFVAEAPWDEAHTACAFASLCSVRFPGYTKAQLEKILALDGATVAPELQAAYRDFLPIFIAYFWEICRDLHELRYSCRAAFHQSMQPVSQRPGAIRP